MLTMWSIQSQAEQYVPGMIRTRRSVEKISASTSVGPVKESPSQEKQVSTFQEREAETYLGSGTDSSEREPAILAKQVMTTPVITIDLYASVAEAWKLFRERRFRHVPVTKGDHRIVGILSDRDLWREAAGIRKHPEAESIAVQDLKVEDIMTAQVLTAHPATEIRIIARVMFEERIGAMPIVDDEGMPVGMMTRSDILRTVMNQVAFELWV